jgi:ATP-binding cassette, subfamily B, bacterial PglK
MTNEINFFQYKSLLTPNQQKSLLFFLFLSFLSMIFELLGIGLIFNILQFISNDNLKEIYFLNFLDLSNFDKSDLFIFLMVGVIVIFTLKNLFLIFFEFTKFRFLLDVETSLTKKLFSTYLFNSFLFHVNNNSSILIRNINDVGRITTVLRCLITFIIELTVSLGLIIFLFYVEFIGSTVTIFVIGIFSFIFFKKIQAKTLNLGKERQLYDGKKFQHLIQGFSSIKDVKILQKENFFIDKFSYNNDRAAESEAKYSLFTSLPRLILEWLIVFGMFVLTISVVYQNQNLNTIVPILGVFAAAAFRIMPSITRFMNAMQGIKFALPVVKTLYSEINTHQNPRNDHEDLKNFNFSNQIEIKNISYSYKGIEKKLINDLSLKVMIGDKIGIIGESGVGKTTLINLILGLINPLKGNIFIDNKDLKDFTKEWQSKIGYVSQNVYLSDDTIKNNIAYGHETDHINDEKILKILKKIQLTKLINNLPKGINTKVGELGDKLSGGEKQRLGIARALYNEPKVIIFDEFTSALDITTEEKILEELDIFDENKTIFFVSHRMSTLKKCNKIFQLSEKGINQIK